MRGALALALLLGCVAMPASAQERPQRPTVQSEQEKLDAKLASPFLTKVWWELDWDAAKKRAARENKLILGYFTTSGY